MLTGGQLVNRFPLKFQVGSKKRQEPLCLCLPLSLPSWFPLLAGLPREVERHMGLITSFILLLTHSFPPETAESMHPALHPSLSEGSIFLPSLSRAVLAECDLPQKKEKEHLFKFFKILLSLHK